MNLSLKEKESKISELSSHELHLFIKKKDPKYFQEVLKPYLANKMEKTFMDYYFLEENDKLEQYSTNPKYKSLNYLEKALLVESLVASQKEVAFKINEDLKFELEVSKDQLEKEYALFDTVLSLNKMQTSHDDIGVQLKQEAELIMIAEKEKELELQKARLLDQDEEIKSTGRRIVNTEEELLVREAVDGRLIDLTRGLRNIENKSRGINQEDTDLKEILDDECEEMDRSERKPISSPYSCTVGGDSEKMKIKYSTKGLAKTTLSRPQASKRSRAVAGESTKNEQRYLLSIQEKNIHQDSSSIPVSGEDLGGLSYEEMEAARNEQLSSFTEKENTKEYAETHYYEMKFLTESRDRVRFNSFWANYASHCISSNQAPFLSANFVKCFNSITEVVGALSLLDLEFSPHEHAYKLIEGRTAQLKVSDNTILFSK